MKSKLLIRFVLLFYSILMLPVLAEEKTSMTMTGSTLTILYDTAEMKIAEGRIVFSDAVVFDEKVRVTAEELVVDLDEQKKLASAVFNRNVVINLLENGYSATGEKIEYNAAADQFRLTGKPTINMGNIRVIEPEYVLFNRADGGEFTFRGGRFELESEKADDILGKKD